MIKESSLVDKAHELAQLIHWNQKRRTGEPYMTHPFKVFQSALYGGYNKDIQVVALLHDTYEDSDNKKFVEDKIKKIFGNTIWLFVKLLSHDPSVNYNEYVLQVAKKSKTALIVKLLDMISNLEDSPSSKQKVKYLGAVLYLLNNGIKIDDNIVKEIKRLSK